MSPAWFSREEEDGAEQRQAVFTGKKYNVCFTTRSVLFQCKRNFIHVFRHFLAYITFCYCHSISCRDRTEG